MWIPLRSAKMKGFIFGFQRRVWWPKWTPASSSWRMETDGTVSDLLSVRFLRGPVAGDRSDLVALPAPSRSERSACVLHADVARAMGLAARGQAPDRAGV